jgi:hypothetical protein
MGAIPSFSWISRAMMMSIPNARRKCIDRKLYGLEYLTLNNRAVLITTATYADKTHRVFIDRIEPG